MVQEELNENSWLIVWNVDTCEAYVVEDGSGRPRQSAFWLLIRVWLCSSKGNGFVLLSFLIQHEEDTARLSEIYMQHFQIVKAQPHVDQSNNEAVKVFLLKSEKKELLLFSKFLIFLLSIFFSSTVSCLRQWTCFGKCLLLEFYAT